MPRDPHLDEVRAFNRAVTERIGALEDRYLARDRSLGVSRVLWEIGADGAEVRDLRARLALDSGYLSRVLRSLDDAGLITVGGSPGDRRVRRAELTAAGLEELAILDRRSDELVADILGSLDERRRERLVAAMGEVRRMLRAAEVRIAAVDPHQPAARAAIAAYFEELAARFEGGFDAGLTRQTSDAAFTPPHGVLLLATLRDVAIGCVGLRLHRDEPAEIKRLWVDPAERGLGVGRRLLACAEEEVRRHGATAVRLDTNRALTEAIRLYRETGYREVAPFNDEPYAHHWFAKDLAAD